MQNEQRHEGMWSKSVNGVKARLVVAFEDLKPGLRHAVYVEVMNESFKPVALANLPEIHAELYDSSGNRVTTTGSFSNGPEPILQWATVPPGNYAGLRIDLQTIGVPTREHHLVLLALPTKIWELDTGQYRLEVAAGFTHHENGPPNEWTGELTLPPVEVVVTDDMFSE